MERIPMDAGRWALGLTIDEYIEQMGSCQRAMRRRVESLRLTPFERGLFSGLQDTVYALAYTEDWCGDSLMNLPVLAQIERFAPGLEVRVFPRPSWPDLREYFSARGIHSVPVFFFLNESFEEIGVWVERPQRAYPVITQWWLAHPEAAEVKKRADLLPEEKRELLRPLTEQYLDAMEDWYDQGLQLETVTEIRRILKVFMPA